MEKTLLVGGGRFWSNQSWGGDTASTPPPQFRTRSRYFPSPYTGESKASSPFNDGNCGRQYRHYLMGVDGITSISEIDDAFMLDIGFGVDVIDVVVQDLDSLLMAWRTPDINPKYTQTLTKLDSLSAELFVDWYGHFSFEIQCYSIGLTPFDAIMPKWAYVGLCLPAVGERRYLLMARALYSLLSKVLPLDDQIVKECMDGHSGSFDGFCLLDSIMARFLPVFCASKTSSPPLWEDIGNIAHMAKLWKLHFCLSAKQGMAYTPVQQSMLFLDSIQEHSLLGPVTSLKGDVQKFSTGIDEFADHDTPMPMHLTITGLTSTLTSTASPLSTSVTFANTSRTASRTSHSIRVQSSMPRLLLHLPRLEAVAAMLPVNVMVCRPKRNS